MAQLKLSYEEIQKIVDSLSCQPYREVFDLLQNILNQTQTQMAEENEAEAVAEKARKAKK